MSTSNMELQMLIKAQNTATKQISQVQKQIKGITKNIEKQQKAAKSSASVFKASFLAKAFSVAALVRGVNSLTEAYIGQERAEKRLETLAKNVKGTTDDQIQSLKDQAAALQQLTTIGDEVTIVGQSQLATFQLQADTIKQVTPALLDMSTAVFGVNVNQEQMITISNLLGKAMMGQTGALTRYGITMDDAQKSILQTGNEMERASAISDILKQNFGGLAAEMKGTLEGQIQSVKNEFGDMKEQLAKALIPTINNLLEWINNKALPAFENMAAHTEEIKKVIDILKIAILSLMAVKFSFWITGIVTAATSAIASLGGVSAAITALKVAILSTPVAWALAVSIIGFALVWKQIQKLKKATNQAADSAQDYADVSRAGFDKAKNANEVLQKENEELNGQQTEFAKKRMQENDQLIQANNKRIQASLKSEQIALKEKEKLHLGSLNVNDRNRKKQLDKQIEILKEEVKASNDAARNITLGLEDEVAERGRILKRQFNENKNLVDTGDINIDAIKNLGGVTGGGGGGAATRAIQDQSKKIAEAQQKLAQRVSDSKQTWRDMVSDAKKSLAELENVHSDRIAEIDDNLEKLKNSLSELKDTYNATIAGLDISAAQEVLKQEEKIKELQDEIKKQREEGVDSSALEDQLKRENDALKQFLSQRGDLEDELEEQRRRASLTDFERFVEDQEAKRAKVDEDFQTRKSQIDEEMQALDRQRQQETALFEAKRDEYLNTLDTFNEFKVGYIDGLGEMEARTETSVKILENRLAFLKRTLAEIQSTEKTISEARAESKPQSARAFGGFVMPGKPVRINEREEEIFIPNQAGKIVAPSQVGQSTQININVSAENGASANKIAKAIKSEIESLARSMKLKSIGVPSTI